MKRNELKVKTTMDVNTAKAILDDLAKSFKEGTICIESGDKFVTLKPGDQIALEIKAVQKKGKEKLTVELNWREPVVSDKAEKEDKDVVLLKISGKEPVTEDSAGDKEA